MSAAAQQQARSVDAYVAHVLTRDGVVVRRDVPAATSRAQAAAMAMRAVGPTSRSASARPAHAAPLRTTDCCSFRAIADVADSAFGGL